MKIEALDVALVLCISGILFEKQLTDCLSLKGSADRVSFRRVFVLLTDTKEVSKRALKFKIGTIEPRPRLATGAHDARGPDR